jgi:hypothetical protein
MRAVQERAMDFRLSTIVTDLPAGHCLKVRRATGAVLRVEAGEVWVTETGRRADAVLAAGASYRVERGRAVVIEAIDDTRLAITPLVPVRVREAGAGWRGVVDGVRTVGGFVRRLAGQVVRRPSALAPRIGQ